jgi:hypothetical protein
MAHWARRHRQGHQRLDPEYHATLGGKLPQRRTSSYRYLLASRCLLGVGCVRHEHCPTLLGGRVLALDEAYTHAGMRGCDRCYAGMHGDHAGFTNRCATRAAMTGASKSFRA